MKTKCFKYLTSVIALAIVTMAAVQAQNNVWLQNVAGVQQGSTMSVALSTDGMNNVGAISIQFYYDNTVLAYSNITVIMPEASGMLGNALPTVPPQIGLSWLAAGSNGVNFPAGDILTIDFDVIGCGDVNLDFNLGACEVVDWDVNPILINYTSGSVQMTSVLTAVWTGTADENWGNPANWDGGILPGCNTDVEIDFSLNDPVVPSSKAVYSVNNLTIKGYGALTVLGTLVVNNNFNIYSNFFGYAGSILEDGGLVVNGNTIVERYIVAPTWHLISSPVANATSGMFTGYYLQRYMEPTNSWMDIIPTSVPLVPVEGYAFWAPVSIAPNFSGTLNNGAFSYNMTNTLTQPYGWNLLGNPYPSGMDWDMVAAMNPGMNAGVYYLDAVSGNYILYMPGMGGANQFVPPMQGFFVSAGSATVFSLDYSVRTHASAPYFKNELCNTVVLQAEGNGLTDKAYVRFDENSNAGFEGQADAYKLFSPFNPELPQFFTISGDLNLAFNTLPETSQVNAGFSSETSGDYTLSISEIKDMDYLVLRDKVTGTETNLMEGSYTFNYTAGENPDRFILFFAPLSIDELSAENVIIFGAGQNVVINLQDNVSGNVHIFNLMGQEVASAKVEGGHNQIYVPTTGQLVVKAYLDNGTVSVEKVTLQ
ncbi:MAG: hypothetical protein JW861_05520 [Bacteroidales bacterium]|nr:hypothetical protein [Bacteroidales bacterium]